VHRTQAPCGCIARTVLLRAYEELGRSVPESEALAGAARRRRRAWMMVEGARRLGTGVDGVDYRSVAAVVGDEMIVAVVPAGQADIEVRLG
jgi:hypothetical protein